jgi:hypothetical protein
MVSGFCLDLFCHGYLPSGYAINKNNIENNRMTTGQIHIPKTNTLATISENILILRKSMMMKAMVTKLKINRRPV